MTGEIGTPLVAVTTNHRIRSAVVVGAIGAIFAACVATGVLLPLGSAGHVGTVSTRATNTILDAWRLGDRPRPAVPALRNPMIESWRLGVPAVSAAPALPNRMIDAWRLAER